MHTMSKHSETSIDTAALLSRMPLFDGLPEGQLALLAAHSRGRRLSKGEMLFQKGDAAHGFYLVVYGQMKLAFPSFGGIEKVVDIIGRQQSFGEAVMLAHRPYPVFAEAIIDSLLIHVSKDVIFDLLENDPAFSRRMLIGLAMHNHSLVHDIEAYSLRSSAQRVIGYLLQHCPDDGSCEGSIDIFLPTSKQLTAARLNLTPETLSRILHDLADAGLIEVQGKRIAIHDLRRLRGTLSEAHLDACRPDRSNPTQASRPSGFLVNATETIQVNTVTAARPAATRTRGPRPAFSASMPRLM